MKKNNMSDIIEEYLKSVLSDADGIVEIQRSKIASLFDCVPSQINYVINTRFTLQHGYRVESKRGGGGYIRIREIKMHSQSDLIHNLIHLIEGSINEKKANIIIRTLYDREIITKQNAKLMIAAMNDENYQLPDELTQKIRAQILKRMLKQLLIK